MASMLNWLKQNGRWMGACVGIFAFCVHSLFVAETHTAEFTTPLVDAYAYHVQAVNILDGKVEPAPFWQPPLFPYWLALVYRLIGPSPAAARYVLAIWTVLASLLTFALARRLLAPRLAMAAGLLVPLYGPLLFLFAQLMPTGMAVALDLAALLAFVRLLEAPTVRRALVTGLLIGVAALAVPPILSFLLVVTGWALVRGFADRTRTQAAFLGLSVLMGAAAVIVPVSCRNAVVSGQWVPISTNGGINLYIGNNPEADQTIAMRPGPDWDRLIGMPTAAGWDDRPAESERYFVGQVTRYAMEQPGSFLRGLLVKGRHLVHSVEMPRNVDLYVVRDDSVMLSLLTWKWGSFGFPFGILLPLAVVGLIGTRGRNRERDVLLWFVLLYGAAVILFFPASRYRLPIIPPLIILAVAGMAGLEAAWRESRRRAAGALAIAAWVGCLISLPTSFPTDRVVFAAEMHNDLGVSLFEQKRYPESLSQLLEASKADPSNAVVHCNLGRAMVALGDYGRAEFSCRRALQARPDYADAWAVLGRVLCSTRRYEEAEACYRQLVRQDPHDGLAWNDLGCTLLWQQRGAEALECLSTALRVGGPEALIMANLGDTLTALKRDQEAMRRYRKARALRAIETAPTP